MASRSITSTTRTIIDLEGWLRNDEAGLSEIRDLNDWISPRLDVRFDTAGEELQIFGPDGQRFLTYPELAAERDVPCAIATGSPTDRDAMRHHAERLAAQLRDDRASNRAE